MNAASTAPPSTEIIDEVSKWTVGGGIVTLALFPLALPLIALTAVAALPLLLIPLALGLLVAGVAMPILLVRGLWRRASRALHPGGASPEHPARWAA